MGNNNEGWKSSEAAQHFKRTSDILLPGRQESLTLVARLAVEFSPGEPLIMDIGCGYGDLTDRITELNPKASVCMVDYSDEMIRLAEERFSSNPRIERYTYDLNNGVPDILKERTFNAVVSSYSLHHVDYDNRLKLYSQVKQVLDKNGLFVIADRFTGESPSLREWEFDNWVSWMSSSIRENMDRDVPFDELKRRQIKSDEELGDKPGTLWDMQNDLRQAGFTCVDCIWKSYNMSIIAATDR
ncbi:MAG: class I SAM-dependent methyltransferase [Dehalococcoidales bacterium]|nr:class I SAM-dependent methyltransferase [Dehalococcoidales bacterium]